MRDKWEYGECNGVPARRHCIKGNVQMVLHKAGRAGHKEDYWHDFDSSWWPEFKKNKPRPMKRYQCIKNYYVGPAPAFKAGSVYIFFTIEDTDLIGVVDNFGTTHIVDEDLITIFQELLDLHVDDIPRDEADREPFMTPEPRRKLTAGWAWFLALVITIGFFVLKAFTE